MELLLLITVILFSVPIILAFTWLKYFEKWEDKPSAGDISVEYITSGFQAITETHGILTQKNALIVDVSKWQGIIDFVKLKNSGVVGVIMKCGQGYAIDPKFVENWRKAGEAGLKRGTYWFYDSRVEHKRQAQLWKDALAGDYGELPHFGDYEERYGGSWGGILNFQTFIMHFQNLTNLPDTKLGIYTGYFYWLELGSTVTFFNRFWLWIAWYSEDYKVLIPRPWAQEQVLLWQFTDQGDGLSMGVESRELDLNWFVKGLIAFEQMFGAVESIPPQTGEETMKEIWSTKYSMFLRKAATINSERVGSTSYPIGTRFTVDQVIPPTSGGLPNDRWAHVIRVQGTIVDSWVAVIHNGVVYCDMEAVVDDRPNPRVLVTFTDRDGVVYENWTELQPK